MRFTAWIAALGLALGLAAPTQAETVGIATSNPGSLFHNIGSAVAKAANEAGLKATIQPATSPNQYIPVVDAGEIDFGVANLYEMTLAVDGEGHFDGRPHENLRAVGLVFPLRVAIFVREDSDIETIADLEGTAAPDGYTAQQIILPLVEGMYATAGLSRSDMEPVQIPSVVGGADAFMSGKADSFFFALGAGKVREADAAVGGIRALPVPPTDENLAAIHEHFPVAFFRTEQPGQHNPGILEEMNVVAYPQLVFASTGTSEEAAYELAKAMYNGKETMAEVFAPFNLLEPDGMVANIDPVTFHPGAIKFYEEQGIWPPE